MPSARLESLEGVPVHIPDVLADPEYTFREGQRLAGFRAAFGVPLLREGGCIGVMAMTRSTPRPFTERQMKLVTTFADQAVIALENVRLFDEVQARTRELAQSAEELQALGEVSQVRMGWLAPIIKLGAILGLTLVKQSSMGSLLHRLK
jgi:two-component system, NtrC family, sensor kinase